MEEPQREAKRFANAYLALYYVIYVDRSSKRRQNKNNYFYFQMEA